MKKILIIKHGSLGDIVFALAPITAIKEKFTDSSIHILTEEKYVSIFKISKFFDRIIIDNRKNFISSVIKISTLLNVKYDLIIDLQNSTRTSFYNFFFRLFGSSLICSSRKFSQLRYHIPPQGSETATNGLFNQLKLLKIKKEDNINFDWLKMSVNDNINQQMVLFIPGVAKGSEHKQWQPKKFAEIAKYCEQKKYLVCVVGTEADYESCQPIFKNCKNVLNKINQSPPTMIYSLSLQSSLIITNDTGPGHMASLANCKMIWILNNNKVSKANIPDNKFNYKILSNSVKNIATAKVIECIQEFNLLR